jgi:hypothetical protein
MRVQRIVLLAGLLLMSPVLSGCADGFDIDKLDVFGLTDKKKLPGDRRPLFPEGVPGVTQGIPPEYVKGNQPQDTAVTLPAEPQPPADAKKTAAVEPAAKPKPKAKPRPKPATASAPTQVTVPATPKAQSNQQMAPWPEPQQQPTQQAPQQAQQQQAPQAKSPWPDAAPNTLAPWPTAPSPGTFSR